MASVASSTAQEATDIRLLENAVQLKLLSPCWDVSDVIRAVGIEFDWPDFDDLKKRVRDKVKAHTEQHGMPVLGTTTLARRDRAVGMLRLMKCNPDEGTNKPVFLTDTMRIAGFPKSVCKTGTAEYMSCWRLQKKLKDADEKKNKTTSRPTNVTVPSNEEDDEGTSTTLSPLTQDSSTTESFSGFDTHHNTEAPTVSSGTDGSDDGYEMPDEFYRNQCVWPLPYPDDLVLQSLSNGSSTISLSSRQKPVKLQSITTTRNVRRTTQSAHQERQIIAEGMAIRSSLYKAATLLYSSVVRQQNTLTNFATADKVAAAFNVMSGADFLSGNEIQVAVKENRAGMSPPRRGRASLVPSDEFDAFCDAVFSFAALEQINSAIRSRKVELQSIVGEVLNAYRKENDKHELGEVHFYRRIEMALCRKQNLVAPDKREPIRVQWLTHATQTLNYQRWEECAVELGFARHPRHGEETNGQFIIWLEGQSRRVINLDEMSLSLDASTTRGGGRPGAVPVAVDVQDTGDPTPKSSDKCTLVYGMNFAGEAMPPYIVFPTRATDPSRYKLQSSLLLSLRQVKGRFGFESDRWFDTGFGVNPKGGMGNKAFYKFVTDFLYRLYPDSEDTPGKRVLFKVDTGPGRQNAELQQSLRAKGFYMFPGLPNGTEVGQEMDQLYSYNKTLVYRNRDRLVRARSSVDPESMASLSLADVGWMIHGGKVPLPDGSSVELEEAFNMAFDTEHLQRAQEKCGYCPSTRAALKSPQVRHEVVADTENESASDPISKMLEEIEDMNHKACQFLLDRGYRLAPRLKLLLRRIDEDRVAGRDRVITEPNTRERQDLLAKVKTAGQFFQVTNGGGPMNSNDALIAYARRDMQERALKMQKQKEALQGFSTTTQDVAALLEKKPVESWQSWTVAELKLYIGWKQGNDPKEPFNDQYRALKKSQLKALFESKYLHAPDPIDSIWSQEMEQELIKLQSGEIDEFFVDCGLQQALDWDDEEIAVRLKVKQPSRRSKVMISAFRSLERHQRRQLLDELALLIDVTEDDSFGGVSGVFDDDSDDDLGY